MMYVDLLLNPERFTGYAGASALRIWSSIYKENCFRYNYTCDESVYIIWTTNYTILVTLSPFYIILICGHS